MLIRDGELFLDERFTSRLVSPRSNIRFKTGARNAMSIKHSDSKRNEANSNALTHLLQNLIYLISFLPILFRCHNSLLSSASLLLHWMEDLHDRSVEFEDKLSTKDSSSKSKRKNLHDISISIAFYFHRFMLFSCHFVEMLIHVFKIHSEFEGLPFHKRFINTTTLLTSRSKSQISLRTHFRTSYYVK